MPRHIDIVEVGPRDGLQNESVIVSTDDKVALITDLVEAGARRIEAVSFAHPDKVPQMADAEAVMAAVPRVPGVSYIGLVMNERGWQRAIEAGVDEVNMPVFLTDTFNTRNQGAPTRASIDVLGEVAAQGASAGIPVTATVSVAWGCPFEGEVPTARLVEVVELLARTPVAEIALADTIGVADPWSVTERIEAVGPIVGGTPLRVHFHDTRNTGIANAFAAIEAGVDVIDASVGGIGGCPFAPAATGNIATDDLVYMLDRGNIAHGMSLERLIAISHGLEDTLGRPVPAMLPKAGLFPQRTKDRQR